MSLDVLERAARESYGRLVAWLAAQCGDLQRAEDALADALQAALTSWPEGGTPDDPEAWLLTAARRRAIDQGRRARTRQQAADVLRRQAEERRDSAFAALEAAYASECERPRRARGEEQSGQVAPIRHTRAALPDRRLELLFVCAHPEVPKGIRTPLMLQAVLGITAERIGSVWLIPPATMGQRLARAKRKLKDVGGAFELPTGEELETRLPHVLEAIYAAFSTGWTHTWDEDLADLGAEALWLCQLLVQGFPAEPEALGLYALILFAGARRPAQRCASGVYVPLGEQDPGKWDVEAMEEAERALHRASRLSGEVGRWPGPYQLEAAIQAAHCDRRHTGQTDRQLLLKLYRLLVERYPSVGAYIGYAAACDGAREPQRGLDVLDQLPAKQVGNHAPYWAVRGQLLRALQKVDAARAAPRRAAGLTADPAIRAWLLAHARS